MTKLFDILMAWGRWFTPLGILAVLAGIMAVVVLFIFRWTTNPEMLGRRKNRMIAGLMEFHLFRADPWIALRVFPRLLKAQGSYLCALILPFLLTLVPIAWILVQAQYWVLVRPPLPAEQMICKVTLSIPPGQMLETPFQLQLSSDAALIGAPVRLPDEQSIYWSFPVPPGRQDDQILLRGNGRILKFPLKLAGDWRPIVTLWTPVSRSARLINPRGAILPPSARVQSVELRYPARSWRVAGFDWNGGVLLIAASFIIAWLLKKPMKVNL